MTPTKLLVGQIFVVFAIVILGVWAATQWAASMLGYQAQLGQPWAFAFGVPVYRPWQIFPWWYHYEAYAPQVFDKAGMLAGASGFLGCASAIVGSLWRARQNRNVTTYGSSRWASRGEIERAGLFRNAGVFLGRYRGEYLRHDGPEHVMAFAPTRSGKGVGLVVPTLLSWTGSAVVHDIKGENWTLTAGWRSRFSHCLLFNPTDPRSARYNPLLEVRKGPDEVRDVQNIADILVDPEGALERRSHWEKTSHSLLVGAILHVLYAEEEKTLARVATFLSDPQRSFAHTLRRMMATNHLGTKEHPQVHPVVASAAREAGAELRVDAGVRRVLTEQGRTVGVELANGETLRARAVVANVNPKLLYEQLLEPAQVPAATRERMTNWRCGSGTFRMNVALSRLPEFRALPGPGDHLSAGIIMAPSLDYMDRAWLDARRDGWSREPIVEMLIPSTLDDSLAPPGQHVASLFCQHVAPVLPDGRHWDDHRDTVADLMIATVERYAPGFADSVLGRQVLSPLDLERTFGLVGGDIFHGALSANQLFSARPMVGQAGYRGALPGLYLCGSGTHPGGGVTGAPGHNAAQVVLRDL